MPNLSLQTFGFSTGDVRAVLLKNQPWFVAVDVCNALKLTNATKAIATLDEDERANFKLGRQGSANIINESGLYTLIFKSRKAEAKTFRKWVTNEVLPSIRKTRKYEVPPPVPTLTPAQQRHVQERAAAIVNSDDGFTTYRSLYSKIKTRFQVGTYKDIPRSRYPELCRFLHCLPRGELPKSSKSPEPSPEQMFHDLRDGRYLLLVRDGKTTIEDATGKNLVDAKHVHTLRRNCRILTSQMRACFGEAGEETMGIALEDLPTAVER